MIEPVATDRRPDWQSAAIASAYLGFTYLPVYLAAASSPGAGLIGLWLWFGLCKNSVINLMHECAHQLAFRRRWANELLGSMILAPLVITDFHSYRHRHWEHHKFLGGARDGKLVYRTDVRGVRFLRLVVRSLAGMEAIKRLSERPADPSGAVTVKHAGASWRLVVIQALFLGSLFAVSLTTHATLVQALLATALAYGFVYAYGLGSLTVLAAAVRAIAEHHLADDGAATQGEAALRNLRCNALTRLMFGAYGFGEHATHHQEPAVPYYRLPALTQELLGTHPELEFRPGYLATVVHMIRSSAGTDTGPSTQP